MSSYWVTVDPDPVTGVLTSRGKSGHRHAGRMPCEDGGSHWREAATSQETPGAPWGLDETGAPPLEPGRELHLANTLTSASRTVKE